MRNRGTALSLDSGDIKSCEIVGIEKALLIVRLSPTSTLGTTDGP